MAAEQTLVQVTKSKWIEQFNPSFMKRYDHFMMNSFNLDMVEAQSVCVMHKNI